MAPTSSLNSAGAALLVFEPEAEYRRHSLAGYWGPVTSSIDWCERNYVVTPFIAEFFNTLSNLGMIVLGLSAMYLHAREGMEARYVVAAFTLFLIGVGSAAFHGTLTHIGQQGDETPMVIGSAVWLWCLAFSDPAFEAKHPKLGSRCAWLLGAFVALFGYMHFLYSFVAVFQVLIALMVSTMVFTLTRMWRNSIDRRRSGWLFAIYLGSILIALPLWIIDQHFCVHLHSLPGGLPNPQFHAWWHLLMGANCYMGPIIHAPIRLVALGKKPSVRYWLGVLPYVQYIDGRKL
ncbi:hypothetical protein AB1Y20_015218 [Prymnesium parvum]|uniref:Alkaline ceramidase n=1 Tax=Prymnesium parvum TaxID=97485 RepID=A0AB34K024_PRYPA